MPLRILPLLLAFLTLLAACTTMVPPAEPEPAPPVTAVPDSSAASDSTASSTSPTRVDPADLDDSTDTTSALPPNEEITSDSLSLDPLYAQSEDALRLAFTDGMFGLYRAETNPADAQRLDRAAIQTWLTDLALVSPRAVEFARATLGPVLEQRFVVGLLLPDASQVGCASIRDVLYIPVPERFQGPDRPFTGYIIQDACDVASGELAPFCVGGFGTTESGSACSCTCTTGEAPAQPCVSC